MFIAAPISFLPYYHYSPYPYCTHNFQFLFLFSFFVLSFGLSQASIYHNGRSFPRLFAWYNSRIGIFPPIPSVKRRSRRRRKRSRGNLFFFFLFPSFSAVDMTRAGCMSKLPDKKLAAGATGTHTPSLSAHLGYVNLGLTPLFTYIALRPPTPFQRAHGEKAST